MGKKGQKPANFKQWTEAGQRNLEAWKEENPSHGNLKHGANSKHVRRRYDDRRTREGRALHEVLSDLIRDCGGQDSLTATQRLLINANIRPKLVTLMCINDFINKQETLISPDGELLKCLGQNYIAFSNALRLDLAALGAAGPGKRAPDLHAYVSKTYGDGDDSK